jgi:hypothetical protein
MTSIQAHRAADGDPFAAAREAFDDATQWLRADAQNSTHADVERGLRKRGFEIMRRLEQGHLDLRLAIERVALARDGKPDGVEVRERERDLEGLFGEVKVRRHGFKEPEKAARFPMDEALNLPAERYSLPLRQGVAEEARDGSWDRAVERVDATTGGHVPKRQAEQLTVRAAQDFDAFYAERPAPANDQLSDLALLVMSSDGKGVRMLPQALREATRKEAAAAAAEAVHGDPMAPKKTRRHDKRMAVVTAVWEQERHTRTPDEVIANLRPAHERKAANKGKPVPRPQQKRLNASVEDSLNVGIAKMFDEADRRDPSRERAAIVLLDGQQSQLTAVIDEARKRGRTIEIVLDLIHAIHYLWLAGLVLCRKDEGETERWTIDHLGQLLGCVGVHGVIAAMRATADASGLSKKALKPVEKCISYFTDNADYMGYFALIARGLPIATGVIEGACRHLVQDRLGITGARWDLPGAEAILKLRAIRSSGDWDAYWTFHERRERQRNHAAAA